MKKQRFVRKLVRVTLADIKIGIPRNARGCPVAIACRRISGEFCGVIRRGVLLGDCGFSRFSKRAAKFVADFDDGKPVKPINFYLEVPE
jgi:hypothetical protein